MPTTLLNIGPVHNITQNVVYALPSKPVYINSGAACEMSLDGSTWSAITNPASFKFLRCPVGNTTVSLSNATTSGSVVISGSRQRTATISHAQILTLPTTGIVIVPSQGANRIIFPQYAIYRISTVGGAPYTNLVDASLVLMHRDGGYVVTLLDGNFLNASNTVNTAMVTSPKMALGIDSFSSEILGDQQVFGVNSGVNKDLLLIDEYNGVPNYTGGHVNNSLKVTVSYLVYDVITNEFV